jgi:hypothetical protein
MELSTIREAASCAATQELSSILWNPKVHYQFHEGPLLIPILNCTNIHISRVHLLLLVRWLNLWAFPYENMSETRLH